jgi:enoyl-CoA hydratase
MDLILTGRAVSAAEALQMGLVNRVVKKGGALEAATALAKELAAFPQACMNADRASAYLQADLPLEQAMLQEFRDGLTALESEGAEGAARFASGRGRHGSFDDL